MIGFCQLLRVKQWVKNIFIFFPLIFSGRLFDEALGIRVLCAVVGFCFISSGMYLFNDLKDMEQDKVHPQKVKRAQRLERLGGTCIFMLTLGLLGAGILLCQVAGVVVVLCAVVYIIVHLIYNYFAKSIIILDVFFIALGFLIRIWVGAEAVGVSSFNWLQTSVFFTALFLGFTKRWQEKLLLNNFAEQHRKVLKQYSLDCLKHLSFFCAFMAVSVYIFFVVFPEPFSGVDAKGAVFSIVFVLIGFWRYIYLSRKYKKGGDPSDVMVKDVLMIVCVMSWLVYMGVIIY